MEQTRGKNFSLTQASGQAVSSPGSTLDVQGLASLTIEVTGTFVGTFAFEYRINTTWYALTATAIDSTAQATGGTATGKWKADVAGYSEVRVRCSAFTSGSIDGFLRAIPVSASAGAGGSSNGLGFFPNDSFNNVSGDLTPSASAQVVKAAVTGKSIYITDISISTDTAGTYKLQDNTGTPVVLVGKKYLPANSVWTQHLKTPIKVAVGKEVDLVCSATTGNVNVDLHGYAI